MAFIIKVNPTMPTKDNEIMTNVEGWGFIVKIIGSEALVVPV